MRPAPRAGYEIAPVDPFAAAVGEAPAIGIRPASALEFFQPPAEPVLPPPDEPLFTPPPESLPGPAPESGGQGWLGGSRIGNLLGGTPTDVWGHAEPLVPWHEIGNWCKDCIYRQTSPTGEAGLGRERVMYAPFEIDITQPQGNFTWRTDAAYNLGFPNRSEYFWSLPGRGPALERGVDYVDHRFRMELGGGAFSLATEIPIRQLNPEINENTNGVGDIQLVQKTLLMDGGRWQMTQLLRTVFNNGNARKGLGTGHVSMEPGMLFRWKYNDLTYYHGELKMTFPIAGDPMGASPILKWGVGLSTIYYETDTIAYMPTLEFTNIWFLDGLRTTYPEGIPIDIEADGVLLLAPGMRMVCDTGGDLGLIELGASMPVQLGDNGWYNYLFRFDLRFVY